MNASVRAAGAGDAADLARLHRECFEASWDEAAFHALLKNPAAFALLAGPDADANYSQAFIVIQTAGDESEILTLGTAPSARRAGLARALLQHAAKKAAHFGARVMFLEVAEDNAPALVLYEKAGFVMAGRRKGYYLRPGGKAADALMLRLALAT